jgi:serine protease AprX
VRIERDWLEQLIFGSATARRYTQDSPILPDVWLRYGADVERPLERPVDLLFTPHRSASAFELAALLIERLKEVRAGDDRAERHPFYEPTSFAYNQTTVVARLHFDELLRVALPLSEWWVEYVQGGTEAAGSPDFGATDVREEIASGLAALTRAEEARRGAETERAPPEPHGEGGWRPTPELLWLVRLAGVLLLSRDAEAPVQDLEARKRVFDEQVEAHRALATRFCTLMEDAPPAPAADAPSLFMVSVNRAAHPALRRSVLAVKADAARRLFKLSCRGINWAVLDSGIDATHPAFRKRAADGTPARAAFEPARADGRGRAGRHRNNTRVIATYDFTRVRLLLSPEMDDVRRVIDGLERALERAGGEDRAERSRELELWKRLEGDERLAGVEAKRLRQALGQGRAINWSELEPLLRVPHDNDYRAPVHDHGTHVAGILGADWRAGDADELNDPRDRTTEEDVEGVCPDINLYDLRVFDDHGRGDEFSIMAALQFVRYLNANRDAPVIHGVNLSLSIRHDVANYACGRTPVCDEGERVVSSGVVVIAAAGNDGYMQYTTPTGRAEGYRSISITDPGNAEAVITVGATHRFHPHTYGVSYFSSRGPTGDGRVKPDLVAPGEKIEAPVPVGSDVKDGTSMAAPHVSGAAALLMSRHRELIGQPMRIKQVLCGTATDLGRERYFQGSGMLDVLRALQHV